jgi:hypothetical protein
MSLFFGIGMNLIFFLLLLTTPLLSVVTETRRIIFKDYPGAYNPSIFKLGERFLLTFRYADKGQEFWISYIGIAQFTLAWEPIGAPELLNTRPLNSKTPSQSEDARIFAYRNRLFLIYNDNVDVADPQFSDRRDMFMAEICSKGSSFALSPPLKLVHPAKYPSVLWQKNWLPFEYNKQLFFIYSIDPHEILATDLFSGACYEAYETKAKFSWNYGKLRGSTPPHLFEGEYLAFFHSGKILASAASNKRDAWHVIFPGGFVVCDDAIYVAYGRDDREIWIATLDKEALKKALIPQEK